MTAAFHKLFCPKEHPLRTISEQRSPKVEKQFFRHVCSLVWDWPVNLSGCLEVDGIVEAKPFKYSDFILKGGGAKPKHLGVMIGNSVLGFKL
jgi:hypothetical protein